MKTKAPLIVHLRERSLANGKVRLFLDITRNGKRWTESTHLFLEPGTSRFQKKKNEETMEIAQNIRREREAQLRDAMLGIQQEGTGYLDLFYEYFRECMKRYEGTRTLQMWKSALAHMLVYDADETLTFADVDRKWVEGFKRYLEKDAIVLRAPGDPENKWRKHNNDKAPVGEVRLASSSQRVLFQKLVCCLNMAVHDKIIRSSPAAGVEGIKSTESKREYLTKEELALLLAAKTKSRVRNAFLFCCLTGLRYSDVAGLKWSDVTEENGKLLLSVLMDKVNRYVYVPVNESASALMGDRLGPDELVFDLPTNRSCNRSIERWVKSAGIMKHITFHSSRHTFATQLISHNVDIYTTSKLLGHTDVKVTQIYAKLVDEKRRAAIDALDGLL